MKKLIIYTLLLLGFSSCNKFLDVKPDDQVYEEEVFSNERGFTKALTGVYRAMASNGLYGRSLKYGVMDLMVGYWNVPADDIVSNDFKNFRYNNGTARGQIDAIWTGLYNAIHQTNIIISYLPNIEGKPNYNIIAGEAYGLRGYLHMEILKIFGPVISQEGINAIAIPYYLSPTHKPEKYKTAKETLDLIEADLQKAAELLKEDPIIKIGRTGNQNDPNVGDYSALLDRRGIRMNYYAVKGLLARKSLLAGDSNVAYDRAMEVINELKETEAIRFVTFDDIYDDHKDLRFTSENLFAVYNNLSYFNFSNDFVKGNGHSVAYENNLDKIYESGTGSPYDMRFVWGIDGESEEYFVKFFSPENESLPALVNHASHELQLMNLPELYFIASEVKIEDNLEEAVSLLQDFRAARGIYDEIPNSSKAEVQQALIDEVRREYIGEGFLFSFYKRKFLPIPVTGKIVQPSLAIYKFPIPLSEDLYNPKP